MQYASSRHPGFCTEKKCIEATSMVRICPTSIFPSCYLIAASTLLFPGAQLLFRGIFSFILLLSYSLFKLDGRIACQASQVWLKHLENWRGTMKRVTTNPLKSIKIRTILRTLECVSMSILCGNLPLFSHRTLAGDIKKNCSFGIFSKTYLKRWYEKFIALAVGLDKLVY